MSGRDSAARRRRPLLRRLSGGLAGVALGVCLVVGLVMVLSRHVDYDWDSEFVALHDRWDAEGVEPGGVIPPGQAPPPATDW